MQGRMKSCKGGFIASECELLPSHHRNKPEVEASVRRSHTSYYSPHQRAVTSRSLILNRIVVLLPASAWEIS